MNSDATRVVHAGLPAPAQGEPFLPGPTFAAPYHLTGDPSSFVRDLEQIEKVSAADVQRVTKQYMSPDKATIVIIPPKGRP